MTRSASSCLSTASAKARRTPASAKGFSLPAAVEAEEVGAVVGDHVHVAAFPGCGCRERRQCLVHRLARGKQRVVLRAVVVQPALALLHEFRVEPHAQVGHPVHAPRLVGKERRVAVGNGDDVDDGHVLPRTVPVLRIPHQPHAALVSPGLRHVRAVADNGAGLGPSRIDGASTIGRVETGEALHGGPVHRCHHGEGHRRQPVGHGLRKRQHDGAVIRGMHRHQFVALGKGLLPALRRALRGALGGGKRGELLELRLAERVELLGARDLLHESRVVGGKVRQHGPAPCIDEVLRDHRVAVRPARIGAQVERPRQAIRRHLPAIGGAGQRAAALRVHDHERLVDGPREADVVLVRHALRVERLEVVRLHHREVGARPGGVEAREQQQQDRKQDGGQGQLHGDCIDRHREVRGANAGRSVDFVPCAACLPS